MRHIGWFAVVGAALPLLAFALSLAVPIFPTTLLNGLLVLCPSYILFMATAACEPLDGCSLKVLAMVVASNAVLYGIVGTLVCYVRHRRKKRAVR